MNKYSNFMEFKNKDITPELTKLALDNLPYNYAVQTERYLQELKEAGKINDAYSKTYIIKVRKATKGVFNETIMHALIHIGLENLRIKESFGISQKKATATIL